MKISSLQDCSVFIDTNILIYAFTTTRFTPACEELLEKVRNGVVKGHINSTVIDEFFHKVLLMQVYTEKGMQPKEAIAFLKQNPERIADFSLPFDVTREVLHDYGMIILDTAPLMDEALAFSRSTVSSSPMLSMQPAARIMLLIISSRMIVIFPGSIVSR